MENTEVTFRVSAVTCMGGSVLLNATVKVPTKADAEAIAVLFPKSAKVRATTISGDMLPDGGYKYGDPECINRTFGYVRFQAHFTRDGVTGEFNETGLKRYRSFRRAASNFGFPVEWTVEVGRGYFPTEAEFETYITTQEA